MLSSPKHLHCIFMHNILSASGVTRCRFACSKLFRKSRNSSESHYLEKQIFFQEGCRELVPGDSKGKHIGLHIGLNLLSCGAPNVVDPTTWAQSCTIVDPTMWAQSFLQKFLQNSASTFRLLDGTSSTHICHPSTHICLLGFSPGALTLFSAQSFLQRLRISGTLLIDHGWSVYTQSNQPESPGRPHCLTKNTIASLV